MMKSAKNVLELVGNTPLVTIKNNIFGKLEARNPSGSIKDRMALYMLDVAEKRGDIKPGYEIVEATSGNTGISFALISALKGYRFTAIMPETMSLERREMMEAYGANFILTPTMVDAVKKLEEFQEKDNVWVPGQFENQSNVDCHRETTGKEILEQIDQIGAFIAGVGTGGTLMGVAEALRAKIPDIKIVAVEPAESAVLSGGSANQHKIQGIGSGFIPKIVDRSQIDEIVKIRSDDAIRMSKRLARENGLFVGISSGANVLASLEISVEMPHENVVTILADSADRYLSLGLKIY